MKEWKKSDSFLEEKGIETDDDAEFILIQKDTYAGHLAAKKKENDDRSYISIDDILYIESYGHQIEITSENGVFYGLDPLYRLEGMLDPARFTRISKSVITAKKKVKHIIPSLFTKFVLIMADGRHLEVTRSYYHSFRDAFNI